MGYWWGDEERLDEDVAVFVDVDDGSREKNVELNVPSCLRMGRGWECGCGKCKFERESEGEGEDADRGSLSRLKLSKGVRFKIPKDEVCVAAAASIETAIVGSGAGAADDGMVGCFPAAAAAADQFFFGGGVSLGVCL